MSATEPLVGGLQQPADLLLRDVHVLDPRAGIDARRDLRVRAGRIVELGEPGTLEPEPTSATDSAAAATAPRS